MNRIKSRHGRRIVLSLSPEEAEILKFIGYRNVIIPKALKRHGYKEMVPLVEAFQEQINLHLDAAGVATI